MSPSQQLWNIVRYGVGKQNTVLRYGVVDIYYDADPETARKWAETLNAYRYDRRQGLEWIAARVTP